MQENKYKKAYDRMARYIENAEGCCPAASGYPLEKDNCLSCIGECIDTENKEYNKELAVWCWKEIFMEDEKT